MKKPDLREQANEIDHLLNSELPPRAVAALDALVREISGRLGESPQRWLGAMAVIQSMMVPLTNEKLLDRRAIELITFVMARLTTTPPGIAALEQLRKEWGDD